MNVASGVRLRQGIVEEVPQFGANGRGNQIQLLEDLTSDSYVNAREIGEIFN